MPKGCIYPLSTPLPYYIQLQGPADSLAKFTNFQSNTRLAVKFLRKTGMVINGKDLWKAKVLGEAVPSPVLLPRIPDNVVQGERVMAWEGELIPSGTGLIGTFDAHRFYVKVSLMLPPRTALIDCARTFLGYQFLLTIRSN